MYKKIILGLSLIGLLSTSAKSQDVKYTFEAIQTLGKNKQTPFWLISNKNGLITNHTGSFLYLGFNKDYSNKKFDWTFGLDAAYSSQYEKNALVNQYYIALKHRKIHLFLGAKNPEVSYDNLSFTNGNLIMSGNARPYPKIEIGTNKYLNVPYTNGWFSVKGVLSNGWLVDDRYVKNVNVHHKNFYLRLGKEKGFSFEFGIDHYAQWAGTSPVYGKLESGLKNFAKVFVADPGAVLKNPDGSDNVNESANSLGNHIGQNQLKLNYNKPNYSLTFFMKNMFEDRSGEIRKFKNIRDINYGIFVKLKNVKIVNSILVEYYSTMHQGNPEITESKGVIGYDSYFNNGIYRTGWSNYQRGFGIPLIAPTAIGNDNSIRFANTTIKAFNIGLMGRLDWMQYKFKFTTYKNYGQVYPVVEDPNNPGQALKDYKHLDVEDIKILRRYSVDPAQHQQHYYLELLFPENKLPFDIFASIAYDTGDMYTENLGCMLKISKRGLISKLIKKKH